MSATATGVAYMRFIEMALSLALLASMPAHANDCEAKAAQVVSTLGATIEGRSSMAISLQHAAVPDGLTIGCDSMSSPADGPDLVIGWDTKAPSASFWSLAASAGAIITDTSSKAIEAGARACYDAVRKTKDGIAELSRHEIRYECTLLPEGEGSFVISIFRRDAIKQREIDRQFGNSMAQLRLKNQPAKQ
jgi:hypothetical protein